MLYKIVWVSTFLLLLTYTIHLAFYPWFCQLRHHQMLQHKFHEPNQQQQQQQQQHSLFQLFPRRDASFHDKHYTRILLVADPQMEGDGRRLREGEWWGGLNLWLNDVMLRHVLRSATDVLQPDVMVLLGDIFSFERMRDTEFWHRVARLRSILPLSMRHHHHHGSYQQHKNDHQNSQYNMEPHSLLTSLYPKIWNISGNHDVGYGSFTHDSLCQRWEDVFGSSNWMFSVHHHLWVGVDALVLDGSRSPVRYKAAWDHLHAAARRAAHTSQPVILYTHVPLHKDIATQHYLNCESGEPRVDARNRPQYQTYLSAATTDHILRTLRPVWVFAGHNHDGCVHQYETPDLNLVTQERTVRSVMGDFGGNVGIFDIHQNHNLDVTIDDNSQRNNNNNNNHNYNNNIQNNDGDNINIDSVNNSINFKYQYTDCPFITTSHVIIFLILWILFCVGSVVILFYKLVHFLSNHQIVKDKTKVS